MKRYFNELPSNKTELNQLKICSIGIAILEYETADYIKDFAIFTYSSYPKFRAYVTQVGSRERTIYTPSEFADKTNLILKQIIRSVTDRQIDTMLNNPLTTNR